MGGEVREISRPQGRKAPRPQKEFVFCANGVRVMVLKYRPDYVFPSY